MSSWRESAARLAAIKGFQPPTRTRPVQITGQTERVQANPPKVTARATSAATAYTLKPAPTTLTPEVWAQAVAQLKPHQPELGVLYRLLLTLTAVSLVVRGHKPAAATVPMMVPAVTIAEVAGFSETYLWKLLREHKVLAARWIAWKGWTTTWTCKASSTGTRNVKGGVVWVVRSKPLEPGLRVRLSIDDFNHPWRDLERDVREGHTMRNLEPEARSLGRKKKSSVSNYPAEKSICVLNQYLQSSLTRFSNLKEGVMFSDTELSPQTRLYALWDALSSTPDAGHESRAAWARGIGQLASAALHDRHSLGFWTRCAWTVLRSVAHGLGMDARIVLHQALWDVLAGSSDNPRVRSRGALAIALMHANGWHTIESAAASFKIGREPRNTPRSDTLEMAA